MKSVIVIIFLIFLAGLFVYSVFFSKKAKIKRKLKKADVIGIGDFKDGETGRIIGHIEFIEKPLISPLANRECAYYYVHIEQKVSSGKHSHWKTIIEREVSSKFLIREGDDYAFINDHNLKCHIVQDKKFSSGLWEDATENLEKFLYNNGFESEGTFGFNKTLRYKEGILEDQEKIAVLGKGTWKDVSALNLPSKYGKVLEITSHEDMAVYLSDDPDTTVVQAIMQNSSRKIIRRRKRYRK